MIYLERLRKWLIVLELQVVGYSLLMATRADPG